MEKMNEFSRRFAEAVFARWPQFREHVSEPRDFQSAGDLYIQVPCSPQSRLEDPLVIWTEKGREIGVGLDAYHTHFIHRAVPNTARPERAVFEEAMMFIEALLEDHLVVISYVGGGSTCIFPNEIEDGIAEAEPGESLRIRSWKGTFCRDVQR